MKSLEVPKIKVTAEIEGKITKDEIDDVLSRSHEDNEQTRHYKITRTSMHTYEVEDRSAEERNIDKDDKKVKSKSKAGRCNCFGNSE